MYVCMYVDKSKSGYKRNSYSYVHHLSNLYSPKNVTLRRKQGQTTLVLNREQGAYYMFAIFLKFKIIRV